MHFGAADNICTAHASNSLLPKGLCASNGKSLSRCRLSRALHRTWSTMGTLYLPLPVMAALMPAAAAHTESSHSASTAACCAGKSRQVPQLSTFDAGCKLQLELGLICVEFCIALGRKLSSMELLRFSHNIGFIFTATFQ